MKLIFSIVFLWFGSLQSQELLIIDNVYNDSIPVPYLSYLMLKTNTDKQKGVFDSISANLIYLTDGNGEVQIINSVEVEKIKLFRRNLNSQNKVSRLVFKSAFAVVTVISSISLYFPIAFEYGGVLPFAQLATGGWLSYLLVQSGIRNYKGSKSFPNKNLKVGEGVLKQASNGQKYIEGNRFSLIIKKPLD